MPDPAAVPPPWRGRRAPYPRDLGLAAAFARRVAEDPHAPALVEGTTRLDRAALWLRARQLARGLLDDGLRPGDRVGLRMVRGADLVVAILGVLAAGGRASRTATRPARRRSASRRAGGSSGSRGT